MLFVKIFSCQQFVQTQFSLRHIEVGRFKVMDLYDPKLSHLDPLASKPRFSVIIFDAQETATK